MPKESFDAKYPVSSQAWWDKDLISKLNLTSLKKILDNIEPYNILDWGCGNLMWPIGLFPKSEITGVEISKSNLKLASLNAKYNGVSFNPIHVSELSKIKESYYDLACSFGLLEFLDEKSFREVHEKIYDALIPGGYLICVFYNWRPFSAVFLPHLFRGGYRRYCKKLNAKISKKSLNQISEDFKSIGFKIEKFGGYNPYPSVLWPYIKSFFGFITYKKTLAHWYYSQFILVRKPIN